MSLNINMQKAQEIWRDKIREDREPYFQSLDVDYLKATEAQNTTLKNHIETKKQQLRDAPADSRIAEAITPEELKTIDPVTEIMDISELEQAKLDKLTEIDQDWKVTLNNGWQTPEGWSLGIHTDDVALLNGAYSLAKEAAALGSTDPVTILDTNGEPHSLSVAEMTPLMLAYGQARSELSGADAARRKLVKDATTIEELAEI
tara:strand:- start:1004 stop:1612 length:609 start_codon:yes stop_codon:yes gene_type:complete